MFGVLACLGIGGVVICVGGGAFWFNANKDGLIAAGQKGEELGRAFGDSTDQNGCIDEAFRQLDEKPGLVAEIGVKLFLKSCLDNASEIDGFCDGVPRTVEIMKSVSFGMERCKALGRTGDQRCTRLQQTIQEHCHR